MIMKNKVIDFPQFKIVFIRYFRVFVDGLLGALTAEVISRAVGMEYEEGVKFVVSATFAGGFAALSKVLRDRSNDYEDVVHKLPL